MKKKLIIGIIGIVSLLSLTACNKQIIDTTYSFDRAIINLPNGDIIDGKVDSWNDYESDQIQVKVNGVTYLVHSEDIVLIKE